MLFVPTTHLKGRVIFRHRSESRCFLTDDVCLKERCVSSVKENYVDKSLLFIFFFFLRPGYQVYSLHKLIAPFAPFFCYTLVSD